MKYTVIFILAIVFNSALAQSDRKPVLVIHGGAGTILKQSMSADKEKAYTQSLELALKKGYEILQSGGSSLDAVETVVKILEDNPLFNAGKGAVFTNEGTIELDAAIMNGKTLAAGSVAGITTVKNPISAARAFMEKSEQQVEKLKINSSAKLGLLVCAAAIVLIGFLSWFYDFIQSLA